MKKICFISHSFLGPALNYTNLSEKSLVGGAEIYLDNLTKLLTKHNYDVTVIQSGTINQKDNIQRINYGEIKVIKIKPKNTIFFQKKPLWERFIFFNRTFPKLIPNNTDHIHLHNYLHAKPKCKNYWTGTCHGVDWDIPQNISINKHFEIVRTGKREYLKKKLKNRLRKNNANFAIKKLNKIVSVDSFLLRYVQSQYPEYANKIKVIKNFVDTRKFNDNIRGTIKSDKYPIILFPRNICFGRGIHLALETIRKIKNHFPDCLLILLGILEDQSSLDSYIKKFNIGENILYLQHKDHKEMPGIYRSADIVIIPSLGSEGTSLSCLEAMACKKAVIASNVGGLIDIGINKESIIHTYPESDKLSESIIELVKNRHLKNKIELNGKRWVQKYHNKKIWEKEWLDFFAR